MDRGHTGFWTNMSSDDDHFQLTSLGPILYMQFDSVTVAIYYTRSGARFARPTPWLVTRTNPLRLLLHTLTLALERVVNFRGALLIEQPRRSLTCNICSEHMTSQSANVATRYFSHCFFGCLPEGRRYQQHDLHWWSYHEQFSLLNQAPMFVQPVCTATFFVPVVK